MPRLGYNKSRGGCLRCKQRRVKCDESRPCAACIRHGVQCSLLESPEPTTEPSRDKKAPKKLRTEQSIRAPSLPQPSRPLRVRPIAPAVGPKPAPAHAPIDASRDSVSPLSSPDQFPYFAKFVTGPPQEYPNTWTTDLELMHHYSTTGYLSLPRGLELQHIWQTEIPRLALAYDFLMHQLLAISAYHLAYLHPQKRSHYAILASQHQTDSVQGIRAILTRITNENCHAIFSAASLLSISAFGTLSRPDGADDDHPTIDDLLEAMLLIRGMSQILDSYEDTIRTGPIGKFLQLRNQESITPLLASLTDRLKKLSIPENGDTVAQKLCQAEVSTLTQWIGHASNSSDVPELRVSLTWPIGLTEGYINLLRIRHPSALIVLGYYCIVLNSAGTSFWFVKGWGESILKDASRSNRREWPNTSDLPEDLYRGTGNLEVAR